MSAEPPRKRWLHLAILILVPALILGGIGFAIYLRHYQPLVGNGTGAAWVDPALATDLGSFDAPSGGTFNEFQVDGGNGEILRFGFTLNNYGWLPVTVTSIGEHDSAFFLHAVDVGIGPVVGPGAYSYKATTPFEPFTLGPNEARYVVVSLQLPSCGPPKSSDNGSTSAVIGTQPVRFTVFGMHRDATVVLP